ncbi:subunit of histone acetyltransferase, partial [Turnera subulata]
ADDGLGLSLSLGGGGPSAVLEKDLQQQQQQQPCLKLNLMMMSSFPPHHHTLLHHNHHRPPPSSLSHLFQPSSSSTAERNADIVARTTFLRRIDMNRAPRVSDCEDEAGASSPNSTISSLSGKRSEREPAPIGEEILNQAERASCCSQHGGSDDEDGGAAGDASRKKLRLTKDQSLLLEDTFKDHNTLNTKQKLALAKKLNLRTRQVEVWFQNRRARTKLKQTEVDCEYLKRCCENLREENRRLQKEVQELRALKLSPNHQLYMMHMNPPTTLTMCPSCERVALSSSSTSSISSPPTPIPAPIPLHKYHAWPALPIRGRQPPEEYYVLCL